MEALLQEKTKDAMSHHIKGIVRLEQRVVDISAADLYYEKAGTRVFVFIDQGYPSLMKWEKQSQQIQGQLQSY